MSDIAEIFSQSWKDSEEGGVETGQKSLGHGAVGVDDWVASLLGTRWGRKKNWK